MAPIYVSSTTLKAVMMHQMALPAKEGSIVVQSALEITVWKDHS